MAPDDLAYLAEFLRRRSGLRLQPAKTSLIEARLAPVARRFGFKNVHALVRELRYARDALARAVTEAMTTNESSFFRDKHAFDHFRDVVLPELLEARGETRRLRIWSAACAAGQEAYSIAMVLSDAKLVEKGWSIDVIATDLNSDSIARAEEGVFTEFEVQRGLPARRLAQHFRAEGTSWRVNDALRRMIMFRTFNLLDSYGWLDDLDVVFCRNVLIYLDQKAKAQILDKVSELLGPEGHLLVGHTETVAGLTNDFVPADGPAGYYVKRRARPLPLFREVG
jgi:chemotaxis protein methyltransferase CheR